MKALLHYATHNSAIQNLIQVEQKSFFQCSLPYLAINHQFPCIIGGGLHQGPGFLPNIFCWSNKVDN